MSEFTRGARVNFNPDTLEVWREQDCTWLPGVTLMIEMRDGQFLVRELLGAGGETIATFPDIDAAKVAYKMIASVRP